MNIFNFIDHVAFPATYLENLGWKLSSQCYNIGVSFSDCQAFCGKAMRSPMAKLWKLLLSANVPDEKIYAETI